MKTKKRLQKLIAAAAMAAMACSYLPAAYADSTNPAETMPSYKASDYYPSDVKTNPDAANPYEVDGEKPWQWDYYDMETKKYNPMKRTSESVTTGAFASHGGYGNVTRMDTTTMHGDARDGTDNKQGTGESIWNKTGSYTGAWQQFYPVRSFTAPQTGNITITEADGKITYTGNASDKYGVDFRILLERAGQHVQVWPESGFAHASISFPISFRALSLNIQKGDILRFEMYTPNAASNGSNFLHAKWNPVVSYNSYAPVTEYQASEEFVGVTADLDKYNPGDNWDWNCYVYGDGITWSSKDYPGNSHSPMTKTTTDYKDEQTFNNTANYPIPAGESVVKELYSISGDGVGIGKYWMRGFRQNNTANKEDFFGRAYAVRTFKAKETGEVTISAKDRYGKSAIEGAHVANGSDEKNQRGVRLVKESGGKKIQLWPTEQNKGSAETKLYNEAVYAIVPWNLTIDFPTITTTLQAGDKLHFELANVSPDRLDDSKYSCAVYWDPVVSYTTGVVAKADEITFKNADGELTEFSGIAGSEQDVTVTIPATAHYTGAETVIPIAAVYNQDGTLVSSGIGEAQAIAANTSVDFTVTLKPIVGEKPSDGYIKVFLWDSMETLNPISKIGLDPVLGTVPAAAAKMSFSGVAPD